MKIESSEEAGQLNFLIENVCGKCKISHLTVCKDCFIMKFRLEIANYARENSNTNEFNKPSEKDIECFRKCFEIVKVGTVCVRKENK